LLAKLNKGGFNMIWSKRSGGLGVSLIAVSLVVTALTGASGWSLFAQAAVMVAGLILAAIVGRPTRPAIFLALLHSACIFLLAAIESGAGSKLLPVWLYGGLVMAYWQQLQGRRQPACRRWFRQSPIDPAIKGAKR
jgi:hypothetical protein